MNSTTHCINSSFITPLYSSLWSSLPAFSTLHLSRNNANEEGAELIVSLLEAKELLGPPDISGGGEAMDTFVRIYLVPDEERAMQTKVTQILLKFDSTFCNCLFPQQHSTFSVLTPLSTLQLFKNSSCPGYNETFSFWVSRKHHRHSLWFHLYHSGLNQHTLIGEGELQIGEAKRPLTTWLALSDSRHTNNSTLNFGELMFSLSYLPTAERLTVVVVKGRSLQFAKQDVEEDRDEEARRNSLSSNSHTESPDNGGELSSASSTSLCDMVGPVGEQSKRNSCTAASDPVSHVLVKVYLLKGGKKVSKKKTTIKRMESSPIYNESMIFSVPPYMLGSIQIRLTVAQIIVGAAETPPRMQIVPIGHVIVGNETTGKGLKHWNQMMTSLRKPVAMWHPLRRCPKESSATVNPSGSTDETNKKK